MRTVNAHCANGVESYNHCLKVFAILDNRLYVFRKWSGFNAAMQSTFAYFKKIVRRDIYSHNRINLMTGFFYTGHGKAFRTMRTAGTVRMHMIFYVIRLGNDGKMNAVMTLLSALLLSGRFTKTFVLFYRRLLKPVWWRRFGTCFWSFCLTAPSVPGWSGSAQ